MRGAACAQWNRTDQFRQMQSTALTELHAPSDHGRGPRKARRAKRAGASAASAVHGTITATGMCRSSRAGWVGGCGGGIGPSSTGQMAQQDCGPPAGSPVRPHAPCPAPSASQHDVPACGRGAHQAAHSAGATEGTSTAATRMNTRSRIADGPRPEGTTPPPWRVFQPIGLTLAEDDGRTGYPGGRRLGAPRSASLVPGPSGRRMPRTTSGRRRKSRAGSGVGGWR